MLVNKILCPYNLFMQAVYTLKYLQVFHLNRSQLLLILVPWHCHPTSMEYSLLEEYVFALLSNMCKIETTPPLVLASMTVL